MAYQTALQILGIGRPMLTIHSLGGGQLATLRNKCYSLSVSPIIY